MKTKLLIGMLLAGSSLFAETHFSIGIGVGSYGHAAPPVVAYAPPCPGPGYTWVDGYWENAGPRRFWHAGYWAAPVFRSAYNDRSRFDHNRYNDNRYSRDRDDRGRDDRGRADQNRFGPSGNQFSNGSGRR